MTDRPALIASFINAAGWQNSIRTPVAGDASNRRYERLTNDQGQTLILMDAPPEHGEILASFIKVARFLKAEGLSAPEIYHEDQQAGLLLIEDLGETVFAQLLEKDPAREEMLYQAGLDVLLALRQAQTLELPLCDADWLTRMTSPVIEWYAPQQSKQFAASFQSLFYPLAQTLDHDAKGVILRDYHAENLIWMDHRAGLARVGVLDFQDALLGHAAYDVVSVLQDARRDIDPQTESRLVDYYLSKSDLDPAHFKRAYAILGLQRNLRIVGIFARLCLKDGKPQYVDKIPRVWGYVMRNLEHAALHDIAEVIRSVLPPPTPEYLEHLKSQCATTPMP